MIWVCLIFMEKIIKSIFNIFCVDCQFISILDTDTFLSFERIMANVYEKGRDIFAIVIDHQFFSKLLLINLQFNFIFFKLWKTLRNSTVEWRFKGSSFKIQFYWWSWYLGMFSVLLIVLLNIFGMMFLRRILRLVFSHFIQFIDKCYNFVCKILLFDYSLLLDSS